MSTVLHVAQPTEAGVARCVAALAAAQLRAGLDVVVACPAGGTLSTDLERAGVPWLRWDASRSPGPQVADEVRRLRTLLRASDPSLVHLHSAKAGLAGRLALRGSRCTVFQPHAWSYAAAAGLLRQASATWERQAVRWTDLLVCVSRAERQDGADMRTLPDQVAVVPNGVDARALHPQDRAAARDRLRLRDVPTAVCVGRLTRQKGQDVALAAWEQVRAAVPDAQLVLVGDGPDRAALARAAGAGVVLAGGTTDPASWYAAADVVLAPSRWEGMALTPLEAMACGRSVVASDVTGVAESVPRGAGEVVPPEQPAALAAAVVARLAGQVDPDAEGAVGRAHVQRHHDLDRTTGQTTAAYALVHPRLGP